MVKTWSLHQQEVTGGQLVTISLVPGTVDSDVASECHLCCPSLLPTEKVSSVDSSWGLCASRLNWKKEKREVAVACPCLFPLTRGTEWGPCTYMYVFFFVYLFFCWIGSSNFLFLSRIPFFSLHQKDCRHDRAAHTLQVTALEFSSQRKRQQERGYHPNTHTRVQTQGLSQSSSALLPPLLVCWFKSVDPD